MRATRRACYVLTMPPAWTPELVADRLIAAFRLLPGRPVMSSARGFSVEGCAVEPFGWPERFVAELWDRRVLMTWARCRAIDESVSERYRALGWNRDKAERHRRFALAAIARGLNLEQASNGSLTMQSTAPEPINQA